MPPIEHPSFETIANFSNPDEESSLPLKEAKDIHDEEKPLRLGSYSAVIEIDDGSKVAKISRFIVADDYFDEERRKSISNRGTRTQIPYMREMVDDEGLSEEELLAANLEQAREGLTELANEKTRILETVSAYIGDNVPEFYGYAVVDSPRKAIEARRKNGGSDTFTAEQLEQIPNNEYALMEVWENVDATTSLDHMRFEDLAKLQSDENFKQELADMATGIVALARNEGIMVDIADSRGARVRTVDNGIGTLTEISDFEQRLKGEDETGDILIPRNITYADGNAKLYDLYPVSQVGEYVQDKAFLEEVVRIFDEEEYDELSRLNIDSTKEGVGKLMVVRYFATLKLMGADFSSSPQTNIDSRESITSLT